MPPVKKPQIVNEDEIDPKLRDKMERSVLSRDQAPTMAEQTPDFSTWQRNRSELGPPFDNERITLAQMRQIRKDPMVAFGLHYRKVPLARTEFHMEARDRNGKNPQVAAFVDSCIRRIYARYIFQRTLAFDFGFQAMVKRWVLANPGGVYLDPLEENPENRTKPIWDEGGIPPKIYKAPVPLRPERVQPTFDDRTGEFTGMLYDVPPAQRGAGQGFKSRNKGSSQAQREIDIYHSLWATHQKDEEHGSIYGYPLTGYAREYWWDYNFYRGLRRRAFERMAIPPVTVYHPEGSTVIDETTGDKRPNWEIAIEMGERLRGNAVAAVPSTMAEAGVGEVSSTQRAWEAKFMDVPTDSLKVFDQVFNYLNVMKLRSVWVPEMAFVGNEAGNSGGNIAQQMQEVFDASLALQMQEIVEEINDYMIPHLLWLNFPEFVNNGGRCKMVIHGFRKQDVEAYKQVLQLLGQANSPELMANLDITELLKRLNMPVRDPEELELERAKIAAQQAAGGPPLVDGVTIANPNFNPGATNGGSQPEPAQAGVGFEDVGPEFIYFAAPDGIELSVEMSEVDDFLASLPGSKHYSDKTIRALSVQLRRLWSAHFKRLYRELATQVDKTEEFAFSEDGQDLIYGRQGIMLADPKKVAAATAATVVTERQAKKAANSIVNKFKVSSKVLSQLTERSAVVLRKMLARAVQLDAKNANLKIDETPEDQFDSFLKEQTGRLLKFTHNTFKEEVRDWLVNEIRDGRTPAEISDNMVAHFESFPKSKADRIARSETRDAVNAATLITGEATNVKYVKARDGEEFDQDCKDRNGKLFTIKEAWREMRKEHPYGTLGYELLPRADFSIEYVEALPDNRSEAFAYFDDTNSTAFILKSVDQSDADVYLAALADHLIANHNKTPA